MSNSKTPNKLIKEKSSYLLQHAYNPVNWHAWNEETFELAQAEQKPIFLSIGYSTCHWCHVMAHETFESDEVAEILNKHFVAVKVDREERPDVDNIYMTACQIMNRSGGWPLSAFLDNQKRPFFTGTYFPKEAFKALLTEIAELWAADSDMLTRQAKQVAAALQAPRKAAAASPPEKAGEDAFKYLSAAFDSKYGGFTPAPKFPSPQNLLFLMNDYSQNNRKKSLAMCETTLKAMRNGGIHDHAGGGFSRYSTDNKWLVPHFEKMLYDNALLLLTYSKMYAITNDVIYADTANGIAAYLLRDMRHASGAFFTAEDADSEGVEGQFYVFSQSEIRKILSDASEEFCTYFGVSEGGNFESKNILNNIDKAIPENRREFVRACLRKIFNYRSKRIRPHRDEKILTSLNGLAIAAFSVAGRLLKNPEYISVAKKTSEFIEKNLTNGHGLLSAYFDAPGNIPAFAEDYAFYIWGLTELYSATEDSAYMARAEKLQDKFSDDFFDCDSGGFFLTSCAAEKLLVRTKELHDGAMPSYNSVSLHNLLSIYNHTKDTKYLAQFAKTVKFFSGDISAFPQGYIHSVSALLTLKEALPDMHICFNNICRPPAKTVDELLSYFF